MGAGFDQARRGFRPGGVGDFAGRAQVHLPGVGRGFAALEGYGGQCRAGSDAGVAAVDEPDAGGLGMDESSGNLSGYVEPFDTWSDMSDLIARERWPAEAEVKQIAYFCNAIQDDELRPFDDPTYPAAERQRVLDWRGSFWMGRCCRSFRRLRMRQIRGTSTMRFLVNCAGDPAQKAFDTQFFRCNIDPSELYVLSLPGSAKYRLDSHDSTSTNLYLAGDWTLTDLNIGCIEAAVISARMASRAICGKPEHIYGAFGGITPIVDAV